MAQPREEIADLPALMVICQDLTPGFLASFGPSDDARWRGGISSSSEPGKPICQDLPPGSFRFYVRFWRSRWLYLTQCFECSLANALQVRRKRAGAIFRR
jgi:hypothetical protein